MSNRGFDASGTGSGDRPSEAQGSGARPTGPGCCGVRTYSGTTGGACGSIMRRHPAVTFMICTVVGLTLLAIPVGVILGIIAFLRTI